MTRFLSWLPEPGLEPELDVHALELDVGKDRHGAAVLADETFGLLDLDLRRLEGEEAEREVVGIRDLRHVTVDPALDLLLHVSAVRRAADVVPHHALEV